MRLPWSKPSGTKSADPGPVSKSQAALSGPDGDGKEHDLQYWLDSGFLTLPAGAFDPPATPTAKPADAPAAATATPAPPRATPKPAAT